MQITAAVTHAKGQISIEKVEIAPPKANEVLVKMVASGVCHTDAAGIEQFIPVALPAIFGHEGVGTIEQVGPGVSHLKPGDKVILTFPSCGHCEYCLDARPYACDNFNPLAFGGTLADGTMRFTQNGADVSSFFGQGAFATHAVVDARNAIKVEGLTDDQLSYLCSMGCGVQTGAGMIFNVMKPTPAQKLAVFGCGGVGMASIMAGKIAGCIQIVAVDTNNERLALAKELGATDTVNAKEIEDVPAEIKRLTNGGVDFSAECSGYPPCIKQSLQCLRRHGTSCVVSVTGPTEIPVAIEPELMNPSCKLIGVTEGGANPQTFIPRLVEYFKAGMLPVDKLVKFYDFNDIQQAFEDSHKGVTIKPILKF